MCSTPSMKYVFDTSSAEGAAVTRRDRSGVSRRSGKCRRRARCARARRYAWRSSPSIEISRPTSRRDTSLPLLDEGAADERAVLRRAAAFLRQTQCRPRRYSPRAGTFQRTSNVSDAASRISRKADGLRVLDARREPGGARTTALQGAARTAPLLRRPDAVGAANSRPPRLRREPRTCCAAYRGTTRYRARCSTATRAARSGGSRRARARSAATRSSTFTRCSPKRTRSGPTTGPRCLVICPANSRERVAMACGEAAPSSRVAGSRRRPRPDRPVRACCSSASSFLGVGANRLAAARR